MERWEVSPGYYIKKGNVYIAGVYPTPTGPCGDDSEQAANAALIVAAPETIEQRDGLLEALEAMVEGYVALYAGETFAMAAENDECIKKARKIIAKVKEGRA